MDKLTISTLNRRHFLSYIALGTLGLLTKDIIYPLNARADSEGLVNSNSLETYHIFVPYTTARNGGKQFVTLRSGDDYPVEIPAKIKDGQEMTIEGRGLEGKDITLVLHTLYDRSSQIKAQVFQEIDQKTNFLIPESSQEKCKSVYEQIENGEYVQDLIALDLLDYVIASSKLDSSIKNRYQLASTNSRLVGLQQAIDASLAKSKLNTAQKKSIKRTFAYVRADEPVPDFNALTVLDAIVESSDLPLGIKETYSLASIQSRALTVDTILVNEILKSQKLTEEQKANYLSVYHQVRDGKTVEDTETLKALDSFIAQARISNNVEAVYEIAKQQNLDNQKDLEQTVNTLVQEGEKVRKQVKNAGKIGGAIVPQATNLLSGLGVSAGTGVSISTLSGGAATNATLAALGGGSVATGGLGMLGGLAVATGGAALIGAAGMLSVALVSQMDGEDQKNLGIAIGAGTIAGPTVAWAAWTAASALGVAETLSGAAAISTMIAAFGGISVITGGVAMVASGTALLVWSLLKNAKKREQEVLSQLETRTYTYTEEKIPSSIGEFLQKKLQKDYQFENASYAPNIPLDKLSNAFKNWRLPINENEKAIALIDASVLMFKEGIVFTNQRILWNNNSINYQDLARFVKKDALSQLSDEQYKQDLFKVRDLVNMLYDESEQNNLMKLLREISQQYSSV
ncbi:hypothetical protein [Planktothricoides raciborskii]|uniref:Uncharacterized protein n=1 Tax=Planktothricoides raciborskii FACHB-1370 TaxID=2949576 RepID=A0ABR8EIL7_9CYAN|nr:hypothetical protein [Planktothricoides raciborskii]MBD2545954.1 hypothetical protein [Planktothricoides raciborskii FACHB-1370]MBD2584071.1 hypothetical protein [Planktothricoides raciborskii FACHB-1261]